ncbi:MAG TPA: DUF58 domain-containing protein [Acidimicrobiales bacterium]
MRSRAQSRAWWGTVVPVPTGRLALVAAVLSLAAAALPFPTVAALVVVNLGLIVVAVVDARLSPAPADVPVTRRFPDVVALGQEAELAWRIDNPATRSISVEVADELAPTLRAGRRRLTARVPASGAATLTTRIRPTRRGRFAISALAVRTTGPLGLAARHATRHVPRLLRVYPAFPSRDEAELRVSRARILEVGLRSAQGRGGGTDFDALREYSPDDEFRRIDWAATARSSRAIVRTYRAERNQTILLLLDTGRVMAGRVGEGPRLEHAMDAVMMLTTVATRLGDRAGLVAFDDDVRAVVPPSHGRGQLSRVTEAMYELDAQLVESDYRGAFTSALARFRRRALIVVFTDLAEQAIAESLLPALPLVVRDHLVVVASVQDPEVVGWSRQVPADASDAYRAAAAVAALEERRRVVASLRGRGVTVVDAPPGRLAPELADAYLKVKATGRL